MRSRSRVTSAARRTLYRRTRFPLPLQHRAGLRLALVEIDESSRAAPVDQRPQGLDLRIAQHGVAPQHLKPALENRAEARVLPGLYEATRIGFLIVGQRDRGLHSHVYLLPSLYYPVAPTSRASCAAWAAE